MATAIIETEKGGIFRLKDAFLVTLDWVFGKTADNQDFRYEVRDGDKVRFV